VTQIMIILFRSPMALEEQHGWCLSARLPARAMVGEHLSGVEL
jgi:hypothetical protein